MALEHFSFKAMGCPCQLHLYDEPNARASSVAEDAIAHSLKRSQEILDRRLESRFTSIKMAARGIARDGLVFPSQRYGRTSRWARPDGELETEGLGIMALDMGHKCWGMPNLEIRHGRW